MLLVTDHHQERNSHEHQPEERHRRRRHTRHHRLGRRVRPGRVRLAGGGGVRADGTCSAGATWKLKAKNDNGALEVEAEVDSNVVGQTWTWRLKDNGVRVANGSSVTVAPSGSFR